jgi:ornithine decarboxylase
MKAAGISFDCASAREMFIVKDLGFESDDKSTILFANPCKTPNDIVVAKDLNIPWVTADSKEELLKMNNYNYKPEVVLRIAVDDSGSACPFGAKFGLVTPEAVEQVAHVAKSLLIPVIGISFHVGSGGQSAAAFRDAITLSKSIWKLLQKKNLVSDFKVLDIGGGWSPEKGAFEEQARYAQEGLKAGLQAQRYIAEPGRFYAAPTHDLYVKVVGKKQRGGGSDSGWVYTLDESVYGQFSCIPFDHAKPTMSRIYTSPHDIQRGATKATLFGRTCDSLDWIANSKSMEELNVGDWLYVPDMGAYTTATSTEFNGFPKPDTFLNDFRPLEENLSKVRSIDYPLADMLSVKKAMMA